MRLQLDEQLNRLNKELIIMGSLCENAISMSSEALTKGNSKLAYEVPKLSEQIDEKEREIEARCMKLLLQQQPVAKDLRTISSALKMVTDMERIGRQSADIAEIIALANISANNDIFHIDIMAETVIKMVTESIDAFIKKDDKIAANVIEYDDVVDDCFDNIKVNLIKQFSNPELDGEYAIDLLMIAKYFERIGDHAVNIAKWVLFSITGVLEG